jgi:hypothetical protein
MVENFDCFQLPIDEIVGPPYFGRVPGSKELVEVQVAWKRRSFLFRTMLISQ